MWRKQQYALDCGRARGTGKTIGHQKNYIMMGVYAALKADVNVSAEAKDRVEALVGAKLRNTTGQREIDNSSHPWWDTVR